MMWRSVRTPGAPDLNYEFSRNVIDVYIASSGAPASGTQSVLLSSSCRVFLNLMQRGRRKA
jgi:hypothetical protein